MAIEVYKGNTKLKSAGVKTDMTREHVEEITRCFEDPVYFIENYVKIVHVDKGLVPFKLYDYQKKMVDLILKERFVIQKLPRQSGKCLVGKTKIHIRNKQNGGYYHITIGEFYEWQRFRELVRQFLEKHNLQDWQNRSAQRMEGFEKKGIGIPCAFS